MLRPALHHARGTVQQQHDSSTLEALPACPAVRSMSGPPVSVSGQAEATPTWPHRDGWMLADRTRHITATGIAPERGGQRGCREVGDGGV
jgi:hypothetical protein